MVNKNKIDAPFKNRTSNNATPVGTSISIFNILQRIVDVKKFSLDDVKKLRAQFLDVIDSAIANLENGVEIESNTKNSIDPNFVREYDKWDKEKTGFAFRIGTTSKPLQEIGIDNKKIWWDATKIKKIKKIHPTMTDNIIKQVPSILENPIIVMQSKQSNSRITLFGEVYDENNVPVLAVLELKPSDNQGNELNIIKVASAYGKDTNPQGLINSSNILYVNPNKKIVHKWLTVNRLQLPLLSTKYGLIQKLNNSASDNSIPNSNEIVKKFLDVDSEGNQLSEQQQDYFKNSKARDENGNLLDASTNKAPIWFSSRGLQLPQEVQTIISANNSIYNPNEIVKKSLDFDSDGNKLTTEQQKYFADTKDVESVKYSYQYFVNKPDMKVTEIDDNKDYTPNKSVRESVVNNALESALSVGHKDKSGNIFVYVNDIDTNVIVPKGAIKHSLDRRLNVNAHVALDVGNILKNSIRINELQPRNDNIEKSYVLIGIAKNKVNEPYIVSFVVNKNTNEVSSIDVLYAVNAKKEPTGSSKSPQVSTPATGSTISISVLLDYVNKYYPDILPEDVLKHYEYDRCQLDISIVLSY